MIAIHVIFGWNGEHGEIVVVQSVTASDTGVVPVTQIAIVDLIIKKRKSVHRSLVLFMSQVNLFPFTINGNRHCSIQQSQFFQIIHQGKMVLSSYFKLKQPDY